MIEVNSLITVGQCVTVVGYTIGQMVVFLCLFLLFVLFFYLLKLLLNPPNSNEE